MSMLTFLLLRLPLDETGLCRYRRPSSDAAAYCGLSASTFNKLRLTGNGPVYIKLGRAVLYAPGDLDAWLLANRHKSTSEYLLNDN